jgi:hypothetical protein
MSKRRQKNKKKDINPFNYNKKNHETIYQCQVTNCKKKFKTSAALRNHARDVHKGVIPVIKPPQLVQPRQQNVSGKNKNNEIKLPSSQESNKKENDGSWGWGSQTRSISFDAYNCK